MVEALGVATRTIVVVDDEEGVRTFLKGYLLENGFQVATAADGKELEQILGKGGVDLVILDLMLGDEDGIVIARSVRSRSDIPIIMLTGRGEEIDRIVGLEVGADDYIAKPFSARELLARIKSVLRRSNARTSGVSTESPTSRRAKFVGWTLDLSVRKLFSPTGQEADLTPRQFDLLYAFVSHPRRVLKREQILDLLGGNPDGSFDRSVDVQVMRLRRKIEKNPKKPEIISTVRTGGYLFAEEVVWD
jgi:two-component system OmpR family response regulator